MTSKLKCPACPWCNQPKVLQDDIFVCANTDCSACAESFLHKALAQAKQDLEIATKALKIVRRYTAINQFEPKTREAHFVARKAIKQIEHKEM